MNTILVYHSISAREKALPCGMDISPGRFEQQLSWLSRNRTVVPLFETLVPSRVNRTTAITFDDGFRDNLTNALPLLEKYQMPMTLFVTAGYLEQEDYLSKAELREISQHPLINIGGHGLWHRHLNRLAIEDARFELIESRHIIESVIGRRVDFLAWPYGECNVRLERLSAECGYRAAWSVWKGTNGMHSRWRVPLGRWDNLPRFAAKASGVYELTKAKWKRYRSRDHRSTAAESGVAVLA